MNESANSYSKFKKDLSAIYDAKVYISNNQIEECIECEEVSKGDLVKVERLLDKVVVYSKLLMVLSRNNPEDLEDIEELFDMISTLKTLDLGDIICFIIYGIAILFFITSNSSLERASYHLEKMLEYERNQIQFFIHFISVGIWMNIGYSLELIAMIIGGIYYSMNCPPWYNQ